MLGLLLAAQNSPQAIGGRHFHPFWDWWYDFVAKNPAEGVLIGLRQRACRASGCVGRVDTARKLGWGIGWFLGGALLIVVLPVASTGYFS